MVRKRSLVRRTAAVAVSGAAAVVLAACGSGDDSSSAAGHGGHDAAASSSAPAPAPARQGQYNAADVAFAKGMVPHHRQAVEMADLAPERARSAEVKKLAADIKKAQGPEIRKLSGWLTAWGEEVPAVGAMDHSTHGMGGMMTEQEMAGLRNASGEAFDTAFMEMMIEHHEGAVEMAKTEQADGVHAPARKMAADIIASQSAEIEQMDELLGEH